MVKSLHRSLEAKLASIKDPKPDESDGDEEMEAEQVEGISAKRSGKGMKRKGRSKDATNPQSANDDDTANQPSAVIYIGHLPVGFEEREITVFLNQFGAVKRARVSRSTKTGRSRGYAFVEFSDDEVAKIVAETMSGYFLLEKRLVCHILPNDKVHELMFARPKRVPTKAEKQKKARAETNKQRSADALKGITAKLVKREETKRKKLAALGIDYDFPGYAGKVQALAEPKKKKRKTSDGEKKEEEIDAKTLVVKTPKSKKKRKSKKSGEEKENDTTNDVIETPAAVKSVKKRKKSAKKAQTPKQ